MPRDKNIFTLNPTSLDMKRSVFSRNSQHKTSFNVGEIIPIYLDEILPGDTVSMDLAEVIRTSSPLMAPIMDNLYADVYFFFVPNRLVWSHWQQFCGENDTSAWTQTTTYTIPKANIGMSGAALTIGCIGDYFGLPVYDGQMRTGFTGLANNVYVSELPLRGYAKIWDDWFRDENSVNPILYTIGDNPNSALTLGYQMNPFKASRFHDLFSSCLPAPQKGGSVVLPLGSTAPVIGADTTGTGALDGLHSMQNGIVFGTATDTGVTVGEFGNAQFRTYKATTGGAAYQLYSKGSDTTAAGTEKAVSYSNLVADLSNATAATINQIRMAFQLQKLLEKDARGGTRYIELLKAHFGVTSPDARLQRSEYLCGQRFRINVDQVLSNADTGSSGEPIGQVGGYSKTGGAGSMFTKSFVEHGMLIGLCVIRQDHTYSQGLDKYWLKSDRFDFYYPVLANIGEVPVYKSEIDCRGGASVAPGVASGVFGYQEAWYEYRYKPSRCTSFMNPVVASSLNFWTLGDAFNPVPGLNQTFLEENPDNLDRCLTVQSSTMHQFIADFYFKAKYSRVMPIYSIPGLIDHH